MKALAVLAALAVSYAPMIAVAQTAFEWQPHLVAMDESGNRNIPNFRFDARHTAGGHWQITDENWRRFAPAVGIDLNKWPNALSAPEQLQGQVAGKMWAVLRYLPWAPYNPRLRRDLEMRSINRDTPIRSPAPPAADQTAALGREGRAWSREQIARLTAPSSVYNPMNIALRAGPP